MIVNFRCQRVGIWSHTLGLPFAHSQSSHEATTPRQGSFMQTTVWSEDVESPKPLNQPRVDIWHSPTYCQLSGYITGKHAVISLWLNPCCSGCLWVWMCNGNSLNLTLLFHSEQWNVSTRRAVCGKVFYLPSVTWCNQKETENYTFKSASFTLRFISIHLMSVKPCISPHNITTCILRICVKWKVTMPTFMVTHLTVSVNVTYRFTPLLYQLLFCVTFFARLPAHPHPRKRGPGVVKRRVRVRIHDLLTSRKS